MTDGLYLTTEQQELDAPPICLNNFAAWIDLQPLSTYAGMLELMGNALYRQGRYAEGSEVKHVAQQLREHA